MRFADDVLRMLHEVPAVGRVLAWFFWITIASPGTALVGLAMIGLGFFAHSDDSGSGTIRLLGMEMAGSVRHFMIGGGVAIYLLGGTLLAPEQPRPPDPLRLGIPATPSSI